MSKKLRDLQSRKAKLVQDARAITNAADAAGRDLTEEEGKQFDALMADAAKADTAITREANLIAEEAQLGIKDVVGRTTHERIEDDDKRGFRSFGDFARSVGRAGIGAGIDQRLIGAAAPGTVSNEGSGQDGGFGIPPAFSSEIWRLSLGEDSLIPLTQNTELTGNSMIFPKDETTPWGGNGVQVYWQSEGSAGAASKLQLGTQAMVLHKMMALVPVTNELLEDGAAIGSYLTSIAPERIAYKANESILFGDGVGKPLGALVAKAAYVVAKESGQSANTVDPKNLTKMVQSLLVGEKKYARWIATPDILSALEAMAVGNYPIYLPNNSAAESSYGMLKGMPMYLSEHAAALSSQSDLNLVSLRGYRTITKAGGIETATSMHLYFDADATAFKFVFRLNGQPILSDVITPPKSTSKRSHFVALGAR